MICKIRLALTQAGLSTGYLVQALKVTRPDLPVYNDHSSKVALSNGGQALRGFRSVSLTWDANVLDWHQAWRIRDLVDRAVSDGTPLYATVNRAWNRSGDGQDWIDVSGAPHFPDGIPTSRTRGRMTDSFTLVINALETINDPASF